MPIAWKAPQVTIMRVSGFGQIVLSMKANYFITSTHPD
ncbi:hypothetical protein L580_3362 [Serratia fonticola AU-P3(3)]|nr:hypothetical protein L580_3362 [Serratia fonticola AU-P3(3)]